jgi:hypothetical protein
MNFGAAFIFDLASARKRRESQQWLRPRVVQLLEQAAEFHCLLESGAVRFRADLARRCGLSAMRITQILALLKLAPSIVEWIRSLPPGTPERMVTERALRAITQLPRRRQVKVAMSMIPAFAIFSREKEAC